MLSYQITLIVPTPLLIQSIAAGLMRLSTFQRSITSIADFCLHDGCRLISIPFHYFTLISPKHGLIYAREWHVMPVRGQADIIHADARWPTSIMPS